MKKIVLFGSFLVLFWTSSGMAAAQSLPGLTGPLKDVIDEIKKPVDKIKEPIEKALPPVTDHVKKPIDDVTKEVGKAVDTIVKDVTDVAKNPAAPSGGGGDKPNPAPSIGSPSSSPSELERSTTGATATKSGAARTSRGSRKASGDASRAEPARDTEQVAAAGNTIEPAEVRGTQIVAPATDVDEGVGSGLSLTGVQILTWLIAACGLMAAGIAFNLTGRLRLRVARS